MAALSVLGLGAVVGSVREGATAEALNCTNAQARNLHQPTAHHRPAVLTWYGAGKRPSTKGKREMPTLPAGYFRNRHRIVDRSRRTGSSAKVLYAVDSRVISASTDGIYFARSAQFLSVLRTGALSERRERRPGFRGRSDNRRRCIGPGAAGQKIRALPSALPRALAPVGSAGGPGEETGGAPVLEPDPPRARILPRSRRRGADCLSLWRPRR